MAVVQLTVNDRAVRVEMPGHWTLIQLLRDGLGLLGTKEGCGEGSCGACTVLVDGRLTRACLALAVRADGARVTTVEGVGTDAALHPIQEAFVRHGAIQCGFCTPGFIVTTKALLEEHPRPTDHQIREFLSGNFCRCAGYNQILDAVRAAAGRVASDPTTQGRTAR
jgi:aerobic-type carbon monoxide dehydrogenase small subunit (CoxS/CutS family)